MTKAVTEEMKQQYQGSTKGIVYLFLVQANNLAFANGYEGFDNVDFGAKSPESFINFRIEEIYGTKGRYWRDDFHGFNVILAAAKEAKKAIIDSDYNGKVIEFIHQAITSHVPKEAIQQKVVEIEPSVLVEIAKEQEKPVIVLPEEVTGEQLIQGQIEEEDYDDEVEGLENWAQSIGEDEEEAGLDELAKTL